MPLEVPNLDDRRWADLVQEAQALIPRRAPAWTDHNVHDPGITFIELFAWLVEMQLYQLNRVGERHREVFGRLAGVIRSERTPARVDVLVKGDLTAPVSFSAGTQLTPTEADGLVFETTTAVTLSRSRLQKVFVDDGTESIDQTIANEKAGVVFLAFGERASVGAHFRLGFDRFYPGTESTLRLTVNVFTDDLGGTCGPVTPIPADGGPTPPQPVGLAWEYLGPGSSWLPLTVVSDETYALARDGAITLTVPDDATPAQQQVWIRCRVVRGTYDIEPRLRQISVNGLPCVQIETVINERLGAGNGRPDQSCVLKKKPVLVRATEPAVEIEVGGVMWKLVPSFDAAGPDSTEFVFDAASRMVTFGNGLNGRIPRPGEEVWARRYRTCEGKSGNVARDLSWQFVTQVVPHVTLTNTEPASGGTAEESLNDLELRGRALLNRPYRAVTLRDIERLALGTPHAHVARACAIPDCPTPDRITVVAVPKVRPGRTQPLGQPSDVFLGAVNSHLQQRRLLGDNLRVVGPIYVTVRASARLRLTKGAGSTAVIERARIALDRFLAGTDLDDLSADSAGIGQSQSPCPTLWPFGRAVFPSEVYAVLDTVTGVDAVIGLVLTADRGTTPIVPDVSGAILVPRIGLVISGAHDLAVEQNAGRAR